MKVLLVVDVQNDFVTGALANSEAQARLTKIKDKIFFIFITPFRHKISL